MLALAGFGAASAGAACLGARYRRNGIATPEVPRTRQAKLHPSRYRLSLGMDRLLRDDCLGPVGESGARRLRDTVNEAMKLWISQLAANARWSKLFFGDHRPNLRWSTFLVWKGRSCPTFPRHARSIAPRQTPSSPTRPGLPLPQFSTRKSPASIRKKAERPDGSWFYSVRRASVILCV
jgi:hypothetical protein